MPRIKLDTSLFEPLEVEAGDKVYKTVPFNEPLLKQIREMRDTAASTPDDASPLVIGQVALLYGIPREEAEAMDIRLLTLLIENATSAIAMRGKKQDDPEKNVPKPEAVN